MSDKATVDKLKEMGVLPETGLTVESKREILRSLLEDGDTESANMLAGIPCTAGTVAGLAVGQVWVSPAGVAHVLVGRAGNQWRVQINNNSGLVTASTDDWLFNSKKLVAFIEDQNLSIYDPSPQLDALAESLEAFGLGDEAAELDEVRAEYVEGRSPRQVQRDRLRRAEEQLESLKEQLEKADGREEVERLTEEMNDVMSLIREEGDIITDDNTIAPEGISDDEHVSEPNFLPKV